MATSYVLVAACVLLSVIPGFLSKPADIETFGDERRWAEPRDVNPYYSNQMQQQMQPMPNDIAYTKKNQAVHSGSYEANFKTSSKKVNQAKMINEIIEILKSISSGGKTPPGLTMSYYIDSE